MTYGRCFRPTAPAAESLPIALLASARDAMMVLMRGLSGRSLVT